MIADIVLLMAGSSPHTRGAHDMVGHFGVGDGIIPAYAGSTPSAGRVAWVASDHPRIRGEHLYFDKPQTRNCGSSPHTRGARAARTHARPESSDHPRIRGEHGHLKVVVYPVQGSSPHTRGAPGMPKIVP